MAEKDFPSMTLADFVIQEAKEKTFEIEIKALKQYEKEKTVITEKEIQVVKEEFERKMRKQEMDRKIEHSSLVNRHRLIKMETRNKCMLKIFGQTQYQIYQKITEDKKFYKEFLEKLIIQGLIKLWEKSVVIVCLERDANLIESCLDSAVRKFQDLVKKQMNIDFPVVAKVNKESYLIPRNIKDNSVIPVEEYDHIAQEIVSKNDEDKKCFGGFLMTDSSGLIICKNTIDVRVDLCYQESLPSIRGELFPTKSK